MIYRFKLVSDEVHNFRRIIEIDSEGTFRQLRDAILDSVDYTHDQLDSFYICSMEWDPREEVVMEDTGMCSSSSDLWLMDKTALEELLDDEGQKLMFIFDNLNNRAFYMELKEMLPGENLDAPRCSVVVGRAPRQLLEDVLDPASPADTKTDTDAFGDLDFGDFTDGYNDDDISDMDEMTF